MRCRRSLRINSSKDWCNAPPKDLVRRFGYCPFRKFHPAGIRVVRQNHRIIRVDAFEGASLTVRQFLAAA
jgi:hypothetical protein